MIRVSGLFVFVVLAFVYGAAGVDYYSRLSASVELQNHGPQAIQDRTLIDKSNRGQKLKDAILSFQKLAALGEIGPLQLGMTMDQVVAILGLPPEAWWNHLGESRFDYPGWVLSFQSNALHRVRILTPTLKQLRTEPPVPRSSGTNVWMSVLGPAMEQGYKRDIRALHLVYHTNQAKLTLAFRSRDWPMFQMIMERPGTSTNTALPQVKLNKEHALILALLAIRDYGFTFEEYQPPQMANENLLYGGRLHWFIDFTPKVPSPDSCIYVCIDHITGLPVIWPE